MDYTPITARRVLVAFSLTAFVALLPVVLVLIQPGSPMHGFMADAGQVYRGVVLGAGGATLVVLTAGVVAAVQASGRRTARRTSGA